MTMWTTTRAATYLAVLAATLGGCAAVAPQMDAWKPAPVGMSWEAMQRNTGSFGKDTQTVTTRVADMVWKGSPALALKTPQARCCSSRPTAAGSRCLGRTASRW